MGKSNVNEMDKAVVIIKCDKYELLFKIFKSFSKSQLCCYLKIIYIKVAYNYK